MVFHLSASNPYEEAVYTSVIEDRRKKPMSEMAFLHPDEVHWRAKRPNKAVLLQGYPVDPTSAPKKLLWESKRRAVPDVVAFQQVLAVCARFKDLVERFEPGVHRFIPVAVYPGDKNREPVERYWLNICRRLDSLDREHTTYRWELDQTGQDGFWNSVDVSDGVAVFSRERIGNAHLWVDPHLLGVNHSYCSSAFGDAALAERFSGLNVTPRAEI